ncbi:ATP-binding cassette domain-containing protein [Marinicrinis sediminis]|uniref:ATP-binding cassette domain-containing protein n=1 Tax=Marinicrinis sediminis TaxID=1652465 RepID=A0ABW5RF67_9BACL
MILIRNLVKKIANKPFLKQVSLNVDTGELAAIIGPSGSGKTLLLECITLNTPWHRGTYQFQGKVISPNTFTSRQKLKKQAAYLKDTLGLLPQKTGLQNVKQGVKEAFPFWKRLLGTNQETHMEAMDLMEKLGLLDLAHKPVMQLSGGEKQRVAIAKAIAKGAKVIVADEPVSGLDPIRANEVVRDFKEMTRKSGVTLICTLHRLELAEKYADRIIGMNDGTVVVEAKGRPLEDDERERIYQT